MTTRLRRAAFAGALVSIVVAGTAAPAFGQCDREDASLTSFAISPGTVDTTAAARDVTCTFAVTDPLAGVEQVMCEFQSPSFAYLRRCTATTPVSGTPHNGVYSCVVPFPRYSEPGVWMANVAVKDRVGNDLSVYPPQPPLPSTVTVVSTPDTTNPVLGTFSIAPTAINTSAAARNVTCTMPATDALAGVAEATCIVGSPVGQVQRCTSSVPVSGTRNNGVFACTLTVPRYADAGTWSSTVYLVDQVGNTSINQPSTALSVTSSPEDIAIPSVAAFDFAPQTVDTGSGPRTVTCSMTVADALSGVDYAACAFRYTDPGTFEQYERGCTATSPSSGTAQSGTFTCNVTFPRYTPGGAWASQVTLIDSVGNSRVLDSALVLDVGCFQAEPETTCRFDSKTMLAWSAIAGSERYNVYRGNLSGLTDNNGDHFPDGGYGTCQNSRDPNLTDLAFTDSEAPSPSPQGFTYLVGYATAGDQRGLGVNSYGIERTASPCP